MNRHHSLDGLRAVAASLVIAHHLGVAAFANQLYPSHPFASNLIGHLTASGVELFFVLSAVVLAGPYISGHKTLRLGSYVTRRIERLMPPYLAAWLFAGLVIYLASAYPTWWTLKASLPAFTFTDWFSQIGIVYFGQARFNFAWWSLTTEVAFYILLPLLIPAFAHLLRIAFGLQYALLASVLIAVIASGVPSVFNVPVVGELLIYASCFCSGLVLSSHTPSRRFRLSIMIFGIAWMLAACAYESINVHVGWGMIYFGVVATALDRTAPLTRYLSTYSLVWLGERSYSLFLVHYSVIGLVCQGVSLFILHKSLTFFAVTRVGSLFFSMLLAMVIFHFIERRSARNLATGNTFWPKRPVATALAEQGT